MPQETNGQDAQQPGGETQPETTQSSGRTEISALPADIQDYIRTLRKEAEDNRKALKQFETEQQQRQAAELEQQQKFKELADQRAQQISELQPYQERAQQMEQTLQAVLDAQLSELSTAAQNAVKAIPGGAQAQLDWLAANRALITVKPAPEMDAGARGELVKPTAELSAAQRHLLEMAGRAGYALKADTVANTAKLIEDDRQRRGVRRFQQRDDVDQ